MNITIPPTTIITINISKNDDKIVAVSETLYIFSDYLNAIIPNLCTFIELLCFIILLNNFVSKTSIFCTAYYYILSMGYLFNLIAQGVYIFDIFLPPNYTFGMFAAIIYWYTNLFAGLWNTMLAINRFTTIFFWKQHSQIWSGKSMKFIFLGILSFPFIFNGYIFFDFTCLYNGWRSAQCWQFSRGYKTFVSYSNMINSLTALVLGLLTALAHKIKSSESQVKNSLEKPLLLQSIISSAIFCCMAVTNFVYVNYIEKPGNLTIISFSLTLFINITWSLSHCSSTVLLFCLSKSFRQNFIKFYHLHKIIPGMKTPIKVIKISNSNKSTRFQMSNFN